ncbi:MAG: hypothetical protein RBT63_00530 [Bdellovibrionales bacterium]|nr:hypothetical protein [Bdellovibrionales bacterium]
MANMSTDLNTHLATTSFANDAFSSGQVGSKLWLCQSLENVLKDQSDERRHVVWIYGGWQGVLGFMLLSRGNASLPIQCVRSFDLDPACEKVANVLCENWVWREWQFRAFTKDCNELTPDTESEFGEKPTIIVNTSVEHFDDKTWFERIPKGTIVVLQASDFEHDGAHSLYATKEQLAAAFPVSETLFLDQLRFDYGTWGFNRQMLIGVR